MLCPHCNQPMPKEDGIPYKAILDDLNKTTGKRYRDTESSFRRYVRARWREGFILEDFFYVHKVKSGQWLNDLENNKYLRPETLYGNKFQGYRNEPENSAVPNNLEGVKAQEAWCKFVSFREQRLKSGRWAIRYDDLNVQKKVTSFIFKIGDRVLHMHDDMLHPLFIKSFLGEEVNFSFPDSKKAAAGDFD